MLDSLKLKSMLKSELLFLNDVGLMLFFKKIQLDRVYRNFEKGNNILITNCFHHFLIKCFNSRYKDLLFQLIQKI